MENEVDYLRKDRDRWIEAWRKAIKDAEEARQRHEVEANALREVIRKQDARITDLEARRAMLRERLVCAALAGLNANPHYDQESKTYPKFVVGQADAVLAAMRKEGGGA